MFSCTNTRVGAAVIDNQSASSSVSSALSPLQRTGPAKWLLSWRHRSRPSLGADNVSLDGSVADADDKRYSVFSDILALCRAIESTVQKPTVCFGLPNVILTFDR